MTGIEGVVESIRGTGDVVGWARAGDGAALAILVMRQGEVVGQGATTMPRDDLGGAHGFLVRCTAPVQPAELLSGQVQVMASRTGTPPQRLQPFGPVVRDALAGLIDAAALRLRTEDVAALIDRLRELPAAKALPHSGETAAGQWRDMEAMLAALPPNPVRGAGGISQVGVPVGLVAPDGSVVAGHDGHLFLVEGSNGLLRQYLLPAEAPHVRERAAGWQRLVAARAATCAALGYGFLQVLIPDKASALPGLFPRAIATPSPIWRSLAAGLATDPALAGRVLSALPVLEKLGAQAWPRLDTHLSARGAYEVFAATCAAMGVGTPFAGARFDHPSMEGGDIADRLFPGTELRDIHMMPPPDMIASWPKPEQVEIIDPGRHIGRRIVWRTPDAPVRARVVVFGNSFFERGGTPRVLSWWFARAFTEFHFCWHFEMDTDYIRVARPDWVVCQTVERFLPDVPAR